MSATAIQQNQPDQGQCLSRIIKALHHPQDFSHTLEEIEQDILQLFSAERLTVYQYKIEDKALVSRYKTGEELKEIHLKLGMLSIAGFVGMTQKPVQISNVYNALELRKINPGLMFDHRFDRATGFHTKSMLVLPIEKNGSLLGVLQLMNKQTGPFFNEEDLALAIQLTALIGQKFGHIIKITSSPFAHLVNQKLIKASKLNTFLKQSNSLDKQVALLLENTKLTIEQIGESLEYYFQVPYMSYQPEKYWLHPLAEKLNHGLFKKSRFIILTDEDDGVIVLIEDPKNIARRSDIQNVIGQKGCTLYVGLISDILRYLEPAGAIGEQEEVDEADLALNDATNLQNEREKKFSQIDEAIESVAESKPAKKTSSFTPSEEDLVINEFSGVSDNAADAVSINMPSFNEQSSVIGKEDDNTENTRDSNGFVVNEQPDDTVPEKTTKNLINYSTTTQNNKDSASDRLVNRILADAQRAQATDIYIEPKEDNKIVQIRMRTNGSCTTMLDIPSKLALNVINRIKAMAKLDLEQNTILQTGVFSIRLFDKDQDVSVTVLPIVGGESLVLHLTAFNAALVRTNFQLSSRNEEKLKSILRYQQGLLLMIGDSGLDDTDTALQILKVLGKAEKKSWVVSDNKAIIQSGMQQINKVSETNMKSATILRALSKTACDTVFIDQLETKSDLTQGFQTASTSFVLTSIVAETIAAVIPHLRVMEIEPIAISTGLLGIINQRKVAMLCPNCKQERPAKQGEAGLIVGLYGEHADSDLGEVEDFVFYDPIGCDECDNTGYAAHTLLHEVFALNEDPAFMALIEQRASVDEFKDYMVGIGMRSLLQDGLQKVVQGELDLKELQKVT